MLVPDHDVDDDRQKLTRVANHGEVGGWQQSMVFARPVAILNDARRTRAHRHDTLIALHRTWIPNTNG